MVDATLLLFGTIILGSATSLLASTPEDIEMRLLLLPLIGASLLGWATIMMNPQKETRNLTIGRSIFALFIGTLMPSFAALFHRDIQTLVYQPVLLLLVGGTTSMVVYILSKYFVRHLYERAERDAVKLADAGMDHLASVVGAKVAADAKEIAKQLKDEPMTERTIERMAVKIADHAAEALSHSPQVAEVKKEIAKEISDNIAKQETTRLQ